MVQTIPLLRPVAGSEPWFLRIQNSDVFAESGSRFIFPSRVDFPRASLFFQGRFANYVDRAVEHPTVKKGQLALVKTHVDVLSLGAWSDVVGDVNLLEKAIDSDLVVKLSWQIVFPGTRQNLPTVALDPLFPGGIEVGRKSTVPLRESVDAISCLYVPNLPNDTLLLLVATISGKLAGVPQTTVLYKLCVHHNPASWLVGTDQPVVLETPMHASPAIKRLDVTWVDPGQYLLALVKETLSELVAMAANGTLTSDSLLRTYAYLRRDRNAKVNLITRHLAAFVTTLYADYQPGGTLAAGEEYDLFVEGVAPYIPLTIGPSVATGDRFNNRQPLASFLYLVAWKFWDGDRPFRLETRDAHSQPVIRVRGDEVAYEIRRMPITSGRVAGDVRFDLDTSVLVRTKYIGTRKNSRLSSDTTTFALPLVQTAAPGDVEPANLSSYPFHSVWFVPGGTAEDAVQYMYWGFRASRHRFIENVTASSRDAYARVPGHWIVFARTFVDWALFTEEATEKFVTEVMEPLLATLETGRLPHSREVVQFVSVKRLLATDGSFLDRLLPEFSNPNLALDLACAFPGRKPVWFSYEERAVPDLQAYVKAAARAWWTDPVQLVAGGSLAIRDYPVATLDHSIRVRLLVRNDKNTTFELLEERAYHTELRDTLDHAPGLSERDPAQQHALSLFHHKTQFTFSTAVAFVRKFLPDDERTAILELPPASGLEQLRRLVPVMAASVVAEHKAGSPAHVVLRDPAFIPQLQSGFHGLVDRMEVTFRHVDAHRRLHTPSDVIPAPFLSLRQVADYVDAFDIIDLTGAGMSFEPGPIATYVRFAPSTPPPRTLPVFFEFLRLTRGTVVDLLKDHDQRYVTALETWDSHVQHIRAHPGDIARLAKDILAAEIYLNTKINGVLVDGIPAGFLSTIWKQRQTGAWEHVKRPSCFDVPAYDQAAQATRVTDLVAAIKTWFPPFPAIKGALEPGPDELNVKAKPIDELSSDNDSQTVVFGVRSFDEVLYVRNRFLHQTTFFGAADMSSVPLHLVQTQTRIETALMETNQLRFVRVGQPVNADELTIFRVVPSYTSPEYVDGASYCNSAYALCWYLAQMHELYCVAHELRGETAMPEKYDVPAPGRDLYVKIRTMPPRPPTAESLQFLRHHSRYAMAETSYAPRKSRFIELLATAYTKLCISAYSTPPAIGSSYLTGCGVNDTEFYQAVTGPASDPQQQIFHLNGLCLSYFVRAVSNVNLMVCLDDDLGRSALMMPAFSEPRHNVPVQLDVPGGRQLSATMGYRWVLWNGYQASDEKTHDFPLYLGQGTCFAPMHMVTPYNDQVVGRHEKECYAPLWGRVTKSVVVPPVPPRQGVDFLEGLGPRFVPEHGMTLVPFELTRIQYESVRLVATPLHRPPFPTNFTSAAAVAFAYYVLVDASGARTSLVQKLPSTSRFRRSMEKNDSLWKFVTSAGSTSIEELKALNNTWRTKKYTLFIDKKNTPRQTEVVGFQTNTEQTVLFSALPPSVTSVADATLTFEMSGPHSIECICFTTDPVVVWRPPPFVSFANSTVFMLACLVYEDEKAYMVHPNFRGNPVGHWTYWIHTHEGALKGHMTIQQVLSVATNKRPLLVVYVTMGPRRHEVVSGDELPFEDARSLDGESDTITSSDESEPMGIFEKVLNVIAPGSEVLVGAPHVAELKPHTRNQAWDRCWQTRCTDFLGEVAEAAHGFASWEQEIVFVGRCVNDYLAVCETQEPTTAVLYARNTCEKAIERWTDMAERLLAGDELQPAIEAMTYRESAPHEPCFPDEYSAVEDAATLVARIVVLLGEIQPEFCAALGVVVATARRALYRWCLHLVLLDAHRCAPYDAFMAHPLWECVEARTRQPKVRALNPAQFRSALRLDSSQAGLTVYLERILARIYDYVTLCETIDPQDKRTHLQWGLVIYDHWRTALTWTRGEHMQFSQAHSFMHAAVPLAVAPGDLVPETILPENLDVLVRAIVTTLAPDLRAPECQLSLSGFLALTAAWDPHFVHPTAVIDAVFVDRHFLSQAHAAELFVGLGVPVFSLVLGYAPYLHRELVTAASMRVPAPLLWLRLAHSYVHSSVDSVVAIYADFKQIATPTATDISELQARLRQLSHNATMSRSMVAFNVLRDPSRLRGCLQGISGVPVVVEKAAAEIRAVDLTGSRPYSAASFLPALDVVNLGVFLNEGVVLKDLAWSQISDLLALGVEPRARSGVASYQRLFGVFALDTPGDALEFVLAEPLQRPGITTYNVRTADLCTGHGIQIHDTGSSMARLSTLLRDVTFVDVDRVLIELCVPNGGSTRGLSGLELVIATANHTTLKACGIIDTKGTVWSVDADGKTIKMIHSTAGVDIDQQAMPTDAYEEAVIMSTVPSWHCLVYRAV